MIRVVLGFILAPLVPMAPFILYAYPVKLVVGVPLYVHARKKGTFTFERTVKAAAITGAIIGVIVVIGAVVGFSIWHIPGSRSNTHSQEWR